MKQYFTGFFTAVCLTASVFLFMGSQNKNLGDIEANSISIVCPDGTTKILGGTITTYDEDGQLMTEISSFNSGGSFEIYNKDGYTTGILGTADINCGFLQIFNEKGKQTISLAKSNISGGGLLDIYNQHNKNIVRVGTASIDMFKGDGFINLYDRYGDFGWGQSGKVK